MAIWLKEGKSESEIIEADEKVKRTVESILNDVSKRGDEAVRELSLKNLIIIHLKILFLIKMKLKILLTK